MKILLGVIASFIFFLVSFSNAFAQSEVSSKRVEINLTNQRLYAFENENLVYEFIVSSGKPWWPTPVGEFEPWIKLRYARMQGGSRQYGTYYNLPNVPYVIYFYNLSVPKWRGYGIHGTYWHNNFGIPMSHGCVNLRTEDMEKLYYWMDLSTRIRIYGTTPRG